MSLLARFFIIFFCLSFTESWNYRDKRFECKTVYNRNILENPLYLVILIIIAIILLLLFLGVIKALIGVCWRRIGECGLGMLVDLPKPLDEYQERELRDHPVVHDVGGWPVHPKTKKRTVRVLPNKTEFCLNTIFFMAYPLALLLRLCAYCCCIRNYKDGDEKCRFKAVNVIKFRGQKSHHAGPKRDVYEDHHKEKKDTEYVIQQMRISQCSLRDI